MNREDFELQGVGSQQVGLRVPVHHSEVYITSPELKQTPKEKTPDEKLVITTTEQ